MTCSLKLSPADAFSPSTNIHSSGAKLSDTNGLPLTHEWGRGRESSSILDIHLRIGRVRRVFWWNKVVPKHPGSLRHGPTLPAAHSELSPQSEKLARGDGEAVLGEIQGQSTHVSSIYHLPPQAQHITSLLDIITPSEEWGLAELAEGVFSIYVC